MEYEYVADKKSYFVGLFIGVTLLISSILFYMLAMLITSIAALLLGLFITYAVAPVVIKGKFINLNSEGLLSSELGNKRILWRDIDTLRFGKHKNIQYLTFSVRNPSDYPTQTQFPADFTSNANLLNFSMLFGGFEKYIDDIEKNIKVFYGK